MSIPLLCRRACSKWRTVGARLERSAKPSARNDDDDGKASYAAWDQSSRSQRAKSRGVHKFWTEVVGMQQVGELKPAPSRPNPARMRFYSGTGAGGTHHHDMALVENPSLPEPPAEWSLFGMPMAINHIAVTYPNREAWLQQLAYLQAKGVKFDRRVEHGMTHSLYIHDPNGYGVELLYDLPREIWERDIDAALDLHDRSASDEQ